MWSAESRCIGSLAGIGVEELDERLDRHRVDVELVERVVAVHDGEHVGDAVRVRVGEIIFAAYRMRDEDGSSRLGEPVSRQKGQKM